MSEGIKALVGRKMTKTIPFMGEKVEISKLSVQQVLGIQESAKGVKEDDASGFEVMKEVIRSSVAGGSDLTDDDFSSFPLDELSKLQGEIMKFSGIGAEGK